MGAGNSCRNHPAPKTAHKRRPVRDCDRTNKISALEQFDKSILVSSTVERISRPGTHVSHRLPGAHLDDASFLLTRERTSRQTRIGSCTQDKREQSVQSLVVPPTAFPAGTTQSCRSESGSAARMCVEL